MRRRIFWVSLMAVSAVGTVVAADFVDPELESAVRLTIGRSAGPLTATDLDLATELAASGLGITDLHGIEQMANLAALDLSDNELTDLDPLGSLRNLSHLNLERNKVTDLSPLASLTHLQVLLLLGNQVTDLAPLLGLPALIEVDVRGNPLSTAALADQVPALQQQGVRVRSDPESIDEDEDPDLLPWQFAGPVAEPWEVGVCQVIPAPGDPSVLYAQTQDGLWRSEDGGDTWAATGMVCGASTRVNPILVDPRDPRILYWTDREAYGSRKRILRSRDGGEHWQAIASPWPEDCEGGGMPLTSTPLLAVDPAQPGRLYGLSCGELVVSNDNGQTWQEAAQQDSNPLRQENGVQLMLSHPASANTLCFFTTHASSGRAFLSRSTDGGDHWENRFEIQPHLVAIALDPRSQDGLYGVSADSLYHSEDGGHHWLGLAQAPVSPLDHLTVAIADTGVLVAVTGWSRADNSYQGWITQNKGGYWRQVPLAGVAEFVAPPDPHYSLLAVTHLGMLNLGGLWRSRDQGQSWSRVSLPAVSRPIELVQFAGADRLYAGSGLWTDGRYEPELWMSEDKGGRWQQQVRTVANSGIELYPGWASDPGLGPVTSLLTVPGNPGAMFLQTFDWVIRTADNGATWRVVDPGMPIAAGSEHPRPFAAGEDLYLLTAGGVLCRSEDGGESWRSILSPATMAAAVPQAGGRLYAHKWLDSNLLYSDDQGATWTRTGAMPSMGAPLDLAVHPRDPGRLYGANYLGLAASDDDGRSWHLLWTREAGEPWPQPRIRFDEQDSSRIFFLTGRQVLESRDRGVTWTSIGKGISNYAWINDVAVDPADPTLIYVATPQGVYRLDEDAPVTVVSELPRTAPTRCSLTQNYPNPFNAQTTIGYQLPARQRVSLVVYDVLGRPVRSLVTDEQEAGEYRLTWNGRDDQGREAGSGVYLCRLVAGAEQRLIRLVLVR